MEGNPGLKTFGEVITGIYEFMNRIKIPFFGLDVSLWILFLFGAIGGLAVWFIKKFF